MFYTHNLISSLLVVFLAPLDVIAAALSCYYVEEVQTVVTNPFPLP